MNRRAGIARALPVVIAAGFLGVFFVYPLVALLWRGLGADPGSLVDVATSSSIRSVLWFTVWQAAASVGLTFVVAAPLTFVLARYSFRGRRLLLALVTVPFVLPTVVVASTFAGVLDRFGLDGATIDLRNSAVVIIAAHAFFNVAVVVRSVAGFWRRLDQRPEQAARVLGASASQTFWRVTVPRLAPVLTSAASIVFLFTFTSFGVVLILGGSRRATLETEIYRYAVSKTDFSTGAALAVVQLVAVVALVVANTALSRRAALTESGRYSGVRSLETGRDRWMAFGAVLVTGGFLAVPLGVLVERSLRSGDGYGFGNFWALADRSPALSVSPLTAIGNSLTYALVAMALAVIVGVCASWAIVHGPRRARNALDAGLLLPLGTSAVTVGFGMLIALDRWPLDLRTSWWIVPIAQSLIGLPFVVRAIVPVLRSIDQREREAAAVLGASPTRVWRTLDVPVARPALLVGSGFALAISLGEFGATSFVGRDPDALTVPLAIARLIGRPGELLRGQAMALSVLLMLVTMAAVLVLDRGGDRGVL